MRVQPTEAVHPSNHRFPVDGSFRRPKPECADLMAVRAVHLEVQTIAFVVEFQHAEGAAGRSLQFEFFTDGWTGCDHQVVTSRLYVAHPFVGETH